jgi:hypothetical protein
MFLPSAYSDAQSGAIGTSSWGCNYWGSPGVALIRIKPGGKHKAGGPKKASATLEYGAGGQKRKRADGAKAALLNAYQASLGEHECTRSA